MNKIILSIIVSLFATSSIAMPINSTLLPPKRPDNFCPKPKPAKVNACIKPSAKVWLPPIEIQSKVAPVKK